ncbi:hypothetical protein EMGR_007015 [Emarellia grisea]
MKSEISKSY